MNKKDKELIPALFGTAEPTESEAVHEPAIATTLSDEELRSRLHAKRMEGRGRPRSVHNEEGKRTDGYSRTSFILPDEKVAKIKEIAFRETLTMKEILEYALDMMIERYEKKHGEIKPNPAKYKGEVKRVFD